MLCTINSAKKKTSWVCLDTMDRWEGAKVSTQVASQTNNLPFDQGTIVIPSGRLLSVRSRPVGSSREGTLKDLTETYEVNVVRQNEQLNSMSLKLLTKRSETIYTSSGVSLFFLAAPDSPNKAVQSSRKSSSIHRR